MNKTFVAASAFAFAVMPTFAYASDLYATVRGGPTAVPDMTFSQSSTATLKLDPSTGWTLESAVGMHVAPMVRVEASLGYGRNGLGGSFTQNVQAFVPCGETANNPCLSPNVDGKVRTLSGFGMAYVDIPIGVLVTPYVGAGIGFVRADFDVGAQGRLNTGSSGRFSIMDGSDTALGYRATAGISRGIGPAEVSLAYTFTRTDGFNVPGRGPLVNFTFDRPMTMHSFTAGVSYKF